MGCALFYGIDISPDKPKGLELLLDSAKQGNKMAAYTLFDIYNMDYEYKNDDQLVLWAKNAESFDVSVINTLANRLLDGIGCEMCDANDRKAFELLQKAAKTGDKIALHNLGWVYKEGRGCSIDYKRARELFEKAGKADSFYHLGDIYERGLGVQDNIKKIKLLI